MFKTVMIYILSETIEFTKSRIISMSKFIHSRFFKRMFNELICVEFCFDKIKLYIVSELILN